MAVSSFILAVVPSELVYRIELTWGKERELDGRGFRDTGGEQHTLVMEVVL